MASVPTITDNLLGAKLIPAGTIGISFTPTTIASKVANGEVTFGATDTAKYVQSD